LLKTLEQAPSAGADHEDAKRDVAIVVIENGIGYLFQNTDRRDDKWWARNGAAVRRLCEELDMAAGETESKLFSWSCPRIFAYLFIILGSRAI
jgi:hypothetical protein